MQLLGLVSPPSPPVESICCGVRPTTSFRRRPRSRVPIALDRRRADTGVMTRANSSPASGAQSADSTNLPPLVVLQCAAVMFIARCFFALLDSTSKFLSERYPVWEILFIRYAAHLFLFLIFLTATKRLKSSLRTARPKLQLLRSALLIFVNVMFFITLRYLPLAEAIAMIMLAPLFVALLAVRFWARPLASTVSLRFCLDFLER